MRFLRHVLKNYIIIKCRQSNPPALYNSIGPGYPLAGCSPAEPGAVLPGQCKIIKLEDTNISSSLRVLNRYQPLAAPCLKKQGRLFYGEVTSTLFIKTKRNLAALQLEKVWLTVDCRMLILFVDS